MSLGSFGEVGDVSREVADVDHVTGKSRGCFVVSNHRNMSRSSSAVIDLGVGVNIDGQLTMADHVSALRRSCLFQLRQLRMVRSSLTLEAANTLVHAFVSSRLDYCNSLLYGISDGLLAKLQTVQNAAARIVTGTRKFDHITPVLHQLHWLPVRQRITLKLAMITLKCSWSGAVLLG